ncbi:hypothetical protein B0H13DRAFT_2338494 [Mycena leptocephala]|nr:hypothetical protein B0H13DRAFT_2338494 [Mycena leptocephala]
MTPEPSTAEQDLKSIKRPSNANTSHVKSMFAWLYPNLKADKQNEEYVQFRNRLDRLAAVHLDSPAALSHQDEESLTIVHEKLVKDFPWLTRCVKTWPVTQTPYLPQRWRPYIGCNLLNIRHFLAIPAVFPGCLSPSKRLVHSTLCNAGGHAFQVQHFHVTFLPTYLLPLMHSHAQLSQHFHYRVVGGDHDSEALHLRAADGTTLINSHTMNGPEWTSCSQGPASKASKSRSATRCQLY